MRSLILFCFAILVCCCLFSPSAFAATVSATIVETDTSDYAPGDSVIIKGNGFAPLEQISVEITNILNPGVGDSDGPWYVWADASGNFETHWIVPNEAVDQSFLLTAIGLTSGIVATTTFTDANSKIEMTVSANDTLCAGNTVDICAFLTQSCPAGVDNPLPNRKVLFYFNPGNCSNDGSADDSAYTDANGIACATLQIPVTPGNYSLKVRFDGESQPAPAQPPNSACDTTQRVSLSSSVDCQGVIVANTAGLAPFVSLPADSTVFLCGPDTVCLPVTVTDPNCDIDTIYSNIGMYGGNRYNFDEVNKVRQLGGTVTQVGGGFPGKPLYVATDFVPPVGVTSGVSVTLPNFYFFNSIASYGTFSNSSGNVQYGGQLLSAPTDMTYTLVGAGGPDGYNGDGSVDFAVGAFITGQFVSNITTCNGQSVDLVLFTDASVGGTAQIILKRSGISVYTTNLTIAASSSGSGTGGITVDLPDHVLFNQVYIKGLTGTFRIDAVAARYAPSPSAADICFPADTAGTYRVIVFASDHCTHSGADTMFVTVTMNQPPVVNAGADSSVFQCVASQICKTISFSDPNDNIQTKQLISGPGSLVGNQVCFTPTMSGTNTFIVRATDSCGAFDQDTFNITVTINSAPVATNPPAQSKFLCSLTQQCYTFTASDVNGGTLTWAMLSGPGSITSGGLYCFTPAAPGNYTATVTVTDPCGLKDTTSITYTIGLNGAPVAVNPMTPAALFLCTNSQICYLFTATDPNGNPLTWTKLSGAGTVTTGGNWCFTPSGNGAYSVVVMVADSCGAADTTTLTYNVSINGAPTIAFGNDTTVSTCTPQQICLSYSVSDPQGLAKLTESMISGYGTIDTVNNRICFTPASSGTYQFITSVTDSCGASDRDTINAIVSFGQVATITCPPSAINITGCAGGQVCQAIAITPPTATVTASYGTYSGGNLCFTADTAGHYVIRLIATAPCGADTCDISFNITITPDPNLVCPGTQTKFICAPGQICIPVGGAMSATWQITPIGTYSSGNVCFNADTSGTYILKVKATTPCGVDSCNLQVNVVINSAPVATNPPATIDTFVCSTANICRQFTASDVNGGPLTWSRLSGAGTVSSSGQWCFTASSSGTYSIVAKVADSCSAADTVSMTYNVAMNSAPTIALGNDTTIFVCTPSTVCLPFAVSDPNNNVQGVSIVSGSGTIGLNPNQLCFTAGVGGMLTFVAQVTDSCGATDLDTINVTVQINHAPVVNAGPDQTIFQCGLAPICWPAGATDVDNNLASVVMITGPGTFNGSQICFTPTGTLNYEFVLKATDACGVIRYDTVVIYYTLNTAPVANAGADQTVFQCSPTQICWPASTSDINGNLASSSLISGPGSFNGSQICFTPSGTGLYTFILQAVDGCGASDLDTVNINVTINSAPICQVPNDTTIFQCAAAQVCLPVGATDVNGNLTSCQILSGPGALSGGNWCYTPIASQIVNVTVLCTDACGATCQSDFTVEFKINQAPSIAFANYGQFFLCSPQQICVSYSASDPNDPRPRTVTLVSGSGTLDTGNNRVCFTPTATGIYPFVVKVTDECGLFAMDTINVDVKINSAPVANAGPNQSIFQCAPTSICWPASCSDPDANLSSCTMTGPGTYSGGQICFTPASSGTYAFVLTATDACGLQNVDTVQITVTLNGAPTIALGADTSVFMCTPTQVCMNYSVSDPNGMAKISEFLTEGFGTIDTANNKVCFTPTSSGTYSFVVSAVDSCGAFDRDTIRAIITFGAFADITCPTGPLAKFLCAPGTVCQPLTIAPAGATVTTTLGTYSGGQLCFNAPTSGTYNARVIATTACSADTCDLTFNVTINTAPVADAGPDQSVFQCTPDWICWPVSCTDVNGNLDSCKLISGPGTYNGSAICFTPASSGVYTFILRSVDQCGASDQDTVNITVTLNSAPSLAFGADTSLFLCTPQQVCMSYSVSDPNGMAKLTEVLTAGFGTLDSANNKVCFTPTTAGTYEFIVSVTDSCGLSDRDTIRAIITFGTFADITCPTGPILASLCGAGQVCQTLAITPPGATVTTTLGTYSGGQLCFNADTSGTYTARVIASSSCGADTCNISFLVTIGQAAQLNCPGTQTVFVCAPGNVSVPIGVMGAGAVVTVSPIGSYSSGNIVFPADTSGHYVLTVIAATTCGADTCQVVADVTINSRPVAVNPATPKDTFVCASANICYQFSASDINGGTLTWSKLTGSGTVSPTGQWCFTAGATGAYSVLAAVTDPCGASDTVTLTYNVTINSAPTIAFGNDTTLALCPGGSACLPYTLTDVNANVTLEELVSGSGTINTGANTVCFSPASAGMYTFIVKATDACGATDQDTIHVTVTIGEVPVVVCPGTQNFFLCSSQQICVPVTVTPGSATVTVSPTGTYSGGNVCFTPATSGAYTLTIIASNYCGSDTCQVTVNVTINSRPVAVDPISPKDTFICASTNICYQFAASDVNGGTLNWSRLSGSGTVTPGGLWCFTANSAGIYAVTAAVVDSCGAADTVAMTYNVTQNVAPIIALGNDTTRFQCASTQICLPYTVIDPNNNVTAEQVISGGTIDTVANTVCFTPPATGVYTVIVQVTDGCGAVDRDTINVTVNQNRPPVANAGPDQTLFVCTPNPICWPASGSDPDNNLDSVKVVSGTGSYSAGTICFTPATSGTYTFILRVVDKCGVSVQDTVVIQVTLNSPPVCQVPPNTTYFQCTPTQVSLPVSATDVDGNFVNCQIVSGPGSISGGQWQYTPSVDEVRKVVIECADACGATCRDSFTVVFKLNAPPVVNSGPDSTVFLCANKTICWDVAAADEDLNLQSVELLSPLGTYNPVTKKICFDAVYGDMPTGQYSFVIKATDSCGAVDYDTTVITLDYNNRPVVVGPPNFTAYMEQVGPLCFDIAISDPDNNLSSVNVAPMGTYNSSTGQVCFNVAAKGTYCLYVTATDACGLQTVDTVCIEVTVDECMHVEIEKTHNALQGQHETVNIFMNGSGKPLGGFDFLIAYDPTALTPMGVKPGPLFEQCGWEYFTFRYGASGNCDGCPDGLIRIVGMAETNNGAYHPGCFFQGLVGSMAQIDFMVSNDRTLECMYAPIQFYWIECTDNALSSVAGDTLWISRRVYDFEHNQIQDNSFGLPGYVGAPDYCLESPGPGKPGPQRCIDFQNGGVDIVCADSIDARADVNLNGIAYEIADAVLFSNYFIRGLTVFTVNQAGQVAATDVNADGLVLTVADLVYLIRAVVGDIPMTPKLSPQAAYQAEVAVSDGVLSIGKTDARIGAMSLVLEGQVEPTLHESASQMELKTAYDGKVTRVLIYSSTGKGFIESGPVMYLKSAKIVKSVELGSYDGYVVDAKISLLPSEYSLSQNYPNPFNPVTTIEFALPKSGEWTLTIYNVLGQEVTNWHKRTEAGYQKIDFDATQYASGVYFYRLVADNFTATKKMVLLK